MLLSHLPLRPSTLELVRVAGFEHDSEIIESQKHGIATLAAELQCNVAMAHSVFKEIVGQETATQPNPQTAVDLLQKQQNQRKDCANSILTFSRPVDLLLGGGIPLGQLTELAGAPGTGKTQLAMQLAVNAALRADLSGVCGETVYIDTEGSFSAERCHTLAHALIRHCNTGLARKRSGTTSNNRLWNITANDILDGIHVVHVSTVTDLTTVLSGTLPELIKEKRVKLVVIDSIAFPYRASSSSTPNDFVARTRHLTATAAALTQLAIDHEIAVVAINQMTTKIDSTMAPALGESWAHAVTNRLVLTTKADINSAPRERVCTLTKSPNLPNASAEFMIVEDGVRGVGSTARKRQKS